MTLHYPFPTIRHLDDVLPHIAGKPEFIRVDKDGGYTVINYVFQTSDTFPTVDTDALAVLRECRGLIFDTETGEILSRRFHKFFNVGEKPDTAEIDVGRPHHVIDKLDGSMISPLHVGGGIRWISKMGITHVSMQAEAFVAVHPEYDHFAAACLEAGETPIFEWMSRGNRIVLDYGVDQLVLVAVRDNLTGHYCPREGLEDFARDFNLPLVQAVSGPLDSIAAFVEQLRGKEGIEGVVITFADGHMVKVKTDWYVQLHRAKDQIARERHLIALILTDKLDDLLSMLPEDDRTRVLKFADALNGDLTKFGRAVATVMAMVREEGWDRKTFALNSTDYDHPIRAACFQVFNEPAVEWLAREWGRSFVMKNLGSAGALEKARGVLLTARWDEKETEE